LFNLGPGRAKVFRVRIKAGPNPDPDCIAPNVIFGGGGDDSAGLGINIDPAAC
jgi:hypothetical protein